MSFKIGDRVKTNFGTGKIIAGAKDEMPGVEHDNNMGGHNCRGKGKDRHCFWVYRKDIKKISRGRPKKEKQVKYVAIYDENDVDPIKKFTSRKELIDWIKEAQDDEKIDFDSIEVYPVGPRLEVEIKRSVVLK